MTSTHTYQADSYPEALAWAKKNPGKVVSWDSGEGWTSTGYFCPNRKRVITSGHNKATGGKF